MVNKINSHAHRAVNFAAGPRCAPPRRLKKKSKYVHGNTTSTTSRTLNGFKGFDIKQRPQCSHSERDTQGTHGKQSTVRETATEWSKASEVPLSPVCRFRTDNRQC